ncbi:hypothetical protein D7Z54_22790 [Salibacterium salarium]|uniref:YtxH-like protein n=1 Tax=Salibacterium salarium TaxID=284579 RepID=A0A3R9QI75_9BACI|nr:hypothetical protein [Salibacterium salarium]RSL30976.1 hypothetical protein D7Z54_22790 [Salibacterium salarium]
MTLQNNYVKGAVTGFLAAFTAGLLISPVDGRTARRQTAEKTSLLINYPSKLISAVRGRKQKLHEFGRGRLEFLHNEINSTKEEAQNAAVDEYHDYSDEDL